MPRSASCAAALGQRRLRPFRVLNTSAIDGQLIARSILWGEERGRMFCRSKLVWRAGRIGRVAGHFVGIVAGESSAARRALARYRERARVRDRIARRLADPEVPIARPETRGPPTAKPPTGRPRPSVPLAALSRQIRNEGREGG